MSKFLITAAAAIFISAAVSATTTDIQGSRRMDLRTGWNLQSSCKVQQTGDVISKASYRMQGWYSTSVPTTVLAAQVAAGEFKDPYFGMNLRELPGTDYPIGDKYSVLPMKADSPYACSWWYRTEFRVPAAYRGRTLSLHFDGINYRAKVWINGRKLADAKDVAGAYRTYEFNATSWLEPDKVNILAVEVFAPTEKDLAINWVDWAPAPPDKNMGIWRDVYLTASGRVTLRYPQVSSHVASDLNSATLTVTAEVRNTSDEPADAIVAARIPEQNISLSQAVSIAAGETQTVTFAADQFPQLNVKHPRLWWPVMMGSPALHHIEMRVSIGNKVSDIQEARFGIREITSELDNRQHRLFRINGKPILIRGAGWAPDLMLRSSRQRLETEIRYVLDMHLNTIRLEGKLETDEFYDMADEKGLLIMAGWCCCDIWEEWNKWEPGYQLEIAKASLRSQILRMRSHPSMLVWLNGSDGPPTEDVERAYLQVLQDSAWPNPVLSSASATPTKPTGISGVKMTGPYDWVPPSYWLTDPGNYGGANGFNTETSPGPAIQELECLRRFIPKDHLWPIDEVWNFHAGGERFQNMDVFNAAMSAMYGPPSGLDDYLRKAQVMAYDGQRAMFEAYGRNKYTATGVIQWMLNNAWPSTIWHLYDYYLHPAGGYYGTKKANEPLHIQYSYDDRSVVVVNSRYEPATALTADVRVYDINLQQKFQHRGKVKVEADGVQPVVTIPVFPSEPGMDVYFVALVLEDPTGKRVSSNFYWLPRKTAVIAWEKTPDTTYTPVSSYDDLTGLASLPRVGVELSAAALESGNRVRVRVHNPGPHLAFQVHLDLKTDAQTLVPVMWEDNYFELLPGESRVISGSYAQDQPLRRPTVTVDGWNIEPLSRALAR